MAECQFVIFLSSCKTYTEHEIYKISPFWCNATSTFRDIVSFKKSPRLSGSGISGVLIPHVIT